MYLKLEDIENDKTNKACDLDLQLKVTYLGVRYRRSKCLPKYQVLWKLIKY